MHLVLWFIALVFSSNVDWPPQPQLAVGHPIATIHLVVGDDSFVHAFGRPPQRTDDAALRISTHLAYVEQLLRGRDTAALSLPARWRRIYTLEILARYRRRGQFPEGESTQGYLPTFIDRRGVRCATLGIGSDGLGMRVAQAWTIPFGAWPPRDLMFAVDVQLLANSTYVGLTLGVGARQRHGYWAM